jgi:hypothetical protein
MQQELLFSGGGILKKFCQGLGFSGISGRAGPLGLLAPQRRRGSRQEAAGGHRRWPQGQIGGRHHCSLPPVPPVVTLRLGF